MHRATICVDFDGVIHRYTSGWKGPCQIPDGPVPGAMQWLASLLADKRFHVCIYSSRSKHKDAVDAMRAALLVWFGLAGYSNASELVLNIDFPTQKPSAFLTIDDRAICFDGNFPSLEDIARFQPWYKKGIDDGPD